MGILTAEQMEKRKRINKRIFLIFGVTLILMLAVGIFSEKPATKPEAAMTPEQKLARHLETVKKLDGSITEVKFWDTGKGTRTLGIFYAKDIAFKTFYTIGMNCEDISKKLVQKNLVDDKTKVLYFVHVPTVDKLGNKGTGLAMKIAWDGATLRKINWSSMFPPMFMNLCESVEMRPLLYADFREFAQDKDNATEFDSFIRTVLASHNNL